MREIYLKGHGEEFKGGEYNPVTETQESILKAIEIALGEAYSVNTSKSAWNVIKTYEDRIMLRYYTNDKNELPQICIDGKEVYKKYVPLTEEQDFIREAINSYYEIDIKLNDRYMFQHVLEGLKSLIDYSFNVGDYGFDTVRINNKVARARCRKTNVDKFGYTVSEFDKTLYLPNVNRMITEQKFNELVYGKGYVSDKLKETPKILEILDKQKERKRKNDDIKALNARIKKCKR